MGNFEEMKEWYDNKSVRLFIVILVIILIIVSCVIYFFFLKKDVDKKVIEKEEKVEVVKEKKEEIVKYMIDIKGEVVKPGTYYLNSDKRVIDAIKEAGGLKSTADTSLLNLSKKINDEMVIVVHSKSDIQKIRESDKNIYTKEKCLSILNISNDACISGNEVKKEVSTKVSINKATVEDLVKIPGIGEAKAKDIINYRNKVKQFKTIEELKNIPGIGESIFAKIKENITL